MRFLLLTASFSLMLTVFPDAYSQTGVEEAAEYVLYEELKDQFIIAIPRGWYVSNQNPSALRGVVYFAPLDLQRIPLKGKTKEDRKQELDKLLNQLDQGEIPSFAVDRSAAESGMSCQGLSEAAKKRKLDILVRSPALGKGSKLLEPPLIESISFGGCEGLRVLIRVKVSPGWELVMLNYTASDGKTTYDFFSSSRREFFDKNRPLFEKAVTTVKLTATRVLAVPVPGKTAATPALVGDILPVIMGLDMAEDKECKERKLINTEILSMVDTRLGSSTHTVERWTLDRCGKAIRYQVTLTASPGGGTDYNVGPER